MDEDIKLPGYITTLLAIIGSFLSGFLLKTGFVTAEQLPQLGSAAGVFAIILWRLYAKRTQRVKLVDAIAAPAGKATPNGGSLGKASL